MNPQLALILLQIEEVVHFEEELAVAKN